ncbi:abortive infection family protein [Mesorhizobium sp.]|uniref:abortive infection family protein n=1 Tax=Mesorhizobium sp. TaxID=1871066 RepID=UPI00257FA59B|nr:abortive infection family protein [Mesorhizobium sp.]
MPFSPFVIKALVDTITGGGGNDTAPPIGIYRSGPKIEQFFLDCGIDMRIGQGGRLGATTDALRLAAGQWNGDDLLKNALERVADPRDYLADETKGNAVVDHLNRVLEADRLTIIIVNGKSHLVPRDAAGSAVTACTAKVRVLDFDTVELDIARALANTSTDAEDAVTAACSLLESVCRSILIELQRPLPPKKDIDGLIRAVQDALNLSPGRSDLSAEIEQDVRQVLGGLTSVAKGIGALRTHAGDAHGRERGFKRIDARIARLAVTAASSLALFLIETWEQQQHRALPLREESQ